MDPEVVAQWNDNNPANQDFGIREALTSLPTISIVLPHDDLWNASTGIYPHSTSQGDAWRRAGSVEYINPEHRRAISIQRRRADAWRGQPRLTATEKTLVPADFQSGVRRARPLAVSDFRGFGFCRHQHARAESGLHRQFRHPHPDGSLLADRFDLFTRCVDVGFAAGNGQPLAECDVRPSVYQRPVLGAVRSDGTDGRCVFDILYWRNRRGLGCYSSDFDGGVFRGNATAWDALFALVNQLPGKTDAQADAIYQQLQGRNPDGTLNAALPVHLDMDNVIDYMLLHLYAGVEDWPHHNWIAARNRVDPGTGFQFFTWDQEIAWDGRYRDQTEVQNTFTPAEIYDHLRKESPEFRLRFADRVQKHMFNNGALTVAATQERWQDRADQIEAAIIGESARWGDAREGEVVNVPPTTTVPVLTVNHWRGYADLVHDNYIPQSHPLTITRFTTDGLYTTLGAPQFNQFGGEVAEGFGLTMSTTSGGATIWYTTNGNDPRQLGGAVSSSATAFSGSVIIDGNTTIKARTRVGSTWSAANRSDICGFAGGWRDRPQRDQLSPVRCDRGGSGGDPGRRGGCV